MNELREGERFADRYVIQGRLGAGGMGIVYAARDERLERDVAIKVLAERALGDAEAQARMMREARSAAALENPGIVRVYDVARADSGALYMVMERIRGSSIAARLDGDALTVGAVLDILAALANALAAAHRAGFVHRDVKPENAMIRDDGTVVLLDLGLARSVKTRSPSDPKLTSDGAILGTPAYLSPEQARGRDAGPAADQFSLAIMAFEMLCGRLPWHGATPAAHLAALLTEDPLVATQVNSALPTTVDSVFARAFQSDPDARYPTIDGFVSALRDALGVSRSTVVPAHTLELQPTAIAPSDPSVRTKTPPPAISNAVPMNPKRPRRTAIGALLGLGFAMAVIGGVSLRARSRSSATRASPIWQASSVLACPVFEASGGDAPNGWLGAAAASIACTRAQWMFGGREERVLSPAELLGLPRRVVDAYPEDPYDAPDARSRAVTAARRRATAYIDGRVEQRDNEFGVEVTLRTANGAAVAHATRADRILRIAVAGALDDLARSRAIPRVATVDREIARWSGVTSVDDMLTADIDRALLRIDDDSVCPWVVAHPLAFGSDMDDRASRCDHHAFDADLHPGGGGSSAESLALNAMRRALVRSTDDPHPLADEVDRALQREPTALGRAALAHAEAMLAMSFQDFARARRLMFVVTQLTPRDELAWDDLLDASNGTRDAIDDARAFVAWFPDEDYAWWRIARLHAANDQERALREMRRAYAVYPGVVPGGVLATALRAAHRWSELRSLGADFATRPVAFRGLGVSMLATVDAAELHFGVALQRVRDALGEALADHALRERDGDFMLSSLGIDLAIVLGRENEFADEFVHRVFDPVPPRLSPQGWYAESLLAEVCMFASHDQAIRCVERLEALAADHFFLVEGPFGRDSLRMVAAYVRGDFATAAESARTVERGRLGHGASPGVALALDAANDFEGADRFDHVDVESAGSWNGVDLVHVRNAFRADRHGDRARAVALANRILAAWVDADASAPLMTRLREIVR